MRSGKRPVPRNAAASADIPDGIAELLDRADPAALEALRGLAAGSNRDMAKAARKALFRLGMRSAATQAPPEAPTTAPPRSQSSADAALVSLSDNRGMRLIAFARGETHPPCWAFIVDWQKGVTMAETLPQSLQAMMDEIGEQTFDGRPGIYARVGADDARAILDSEAKRTPAASGFLPAGYRKCRQAVGGEDRSGDEPAIYARIGPAPAARSGIVLPDPATDRPPILPGWALRGPQVDALAERTAKALDTRIILPERQRIELTRRLVREAVSELLPPQAIQDLCTRIETDALVVWHVGERDFAMRAARVAREGRAVTSAADWPFAELLLSHSMRRTLDPDNATAAGTLREQPESLIVRP